MPNRLKDINKVIDDVTNATKKAVEEVSKTINKENVNKTAKDIKDKKRKITLVMVTHSIEEAVFLGDKIVVMEKGSIKQILENPYFGDENIRLSPQYYEICKEVRQYLSEGDKL